MTATLNVSFTVEGQDYGRGAIPYIGRYDHGGTSSSIGYCCRICGRQWAQIAVVTNPLPHGHFWKFCESVCINHPEVRTSLPGSLWRGYYPDYNAAMPPELLRKELLLHCDFFERAGYALY